jgi:hypothetical protein
VTAGLLINSIHDYQKPHFLKGQQYGMESKTFFEKFSKRKIKLLQSSKIPADSEAKTASCSFGTVGFFLRRRAAGVLTAVCDSQV